MKGRGEISCLETQRSHLKGPGSCGGWGRNPSALTWPAARSESALSSAPPSQVPLSPSVCVPWSQPHSVPSPASHPPHLAGQFSHCSDLLCTPPAALLCPADSQTSVCIRTPGESAKTVLGPTPRVSECDHRLCIYDKLLGDAAGSHSAPGEPLLSLSSPHPWVHVRASNPRAVQDPDVASPSL